MFVDTQVRPQGEQVDAVAPKLKLSAAIRIGARLSPQGFGRVYWGGKTCALGAALEGSGFDPSIASMEYRAAALPGVWNTHLSAQIVQKNDRDKWTRERIASWLESQGL